MDSNLPFIPDCLFPSDNDLEIPSLRLDMQPKYAEIPFVLYGEQARTFQMEGNGTLHFYTDDYRFGDSLFDHPEKIIKHNPSTIVEPNYSLYNDTPIAFGMQQIYKKRFISRAMQERGINVFVDLNVSPKFYKLNLLGVPKGYHSFCTRGYEDRIYHLGFEYEIAKMVAGDNQLLFVVYGGGLQVKRFCREKGLIHITPTISMKKKVKNYKKMAEAIAFFGQEVDTAPMLPSLPELLEEQITDYSKDKLIGQNQSS